MILRPLLALLIFLTIPIYTQETPSNTDLDPIAAWRSPALFGLGFASALSGIIGSMHKPYQGKGIAIMRTLTGITKFAIGIAFITCSDRIIYEINTYKKLTLPQKTGDENEAQRYRRSI